MLPDDVLLALFQFHVDEDWSENENEENRMRAWQSLVHVCRRWRSVVFGSPRRLNLRLVCSSGTPAGDTVDVWPALPLVIQDFDCYTRSMDNVVALLEHHDLVRRIIRIKFEEISSSQLEEISEATQVPFPELTHLRLRSDQTEPVLPLSDSFLGGSAPRLRFLNLYDIPYPGLPKLLVSATHLTELHLTRIPHSGYIPPEAMVACLSTLTSLEVLSLGFESPLPRPDWESRRLPPPTHAVLPMLEDFWFKGVGEYVEYFVVRIDAPRLRRLDVTFFNDIVFDTPQLTQFISHTPLLEAFDVANVTLWDDTASVTLSHAYEDFDESLKVSISCTDLDWQLSFLEQVCTSSLPSLSALEDLYMQRFAGPQDSKGNIDYAEFTRNGWNYYTRSPL
jgi:hypothetical protein